MIYCIRMRQISGRGQSAPVPSVKIGIRPLNLTYFAKLARSILLSVVRRTPFRRRISFTFGVFPKLKRWFNSQIQMVKFIREARSKLAPSSFNNIIISGIGFASRRSKFCGQAYLPAVPSYYGLSPNPQSNRIGNHGKGLNFNRFFVHKAVDIKVYGSLPNVLSSLLIFNFSKIHKAIMSNKSS